MRSGVYLITAALIDARGRSPAAAPGASCASPDPGRGALARDEASHRLAEARARESVAQADRDRARVRRSSDDRRHRAATRAPITSFRSSCRAGRSVCRASCTPTCRTTTIRASTCSGRSTPAAGPTRSSAPRGPRRTPPARTCRGPGRSSSRGGARVLGRRDGPRQRLTSSNRASRVRRRTSPTSASDSPPDSCRRTSCVRRGAGVAGTDAGHRGTNQRDVAAADLARLVGLTRTAARARGHARRGGRRRGQSPASAARRGCPCVTRGTPRAGTAHRVGR